MDNNLKGIIEKLDLSQLEASSFKDAELVGTPIYVESTKTLKLEIKLAKMLEFRVYDVFMTKMKRFAHCHIDLKLICDDRHYQLAEVNKYVREIASKESKFSIFLNCFPQLDESTLCYRYSSKAERGEAEDLKEELQQRLACFGIDADVEIAVLELKEEERKIQLETPKVQETPKPLVAGNRGYKRVKVENYPLYRIKDLEEGVSEVKIQGRVFEIEERTTRNGKLAQTISFCDDEEAIVIKRFENARLSVDEMHTVNKGDWLAIYGRVEYDSFRRENVFVANRIDHIEHKEKQDKAVEKRVELHVHTKLSEMDGVSEIEEYVEQAAKWGHSAIAITDHNVVQAFPAAQKAVKGWNSKHEADFKMIYGVEMNMIDPHLGIVTNPDERKLDDARYCVFDLETTGLSSKYDSIIEFGGVIVEDQQVKNSLQLFIRPEHPISAHITQLTNITNEDVKNAPVLGDAMKQILDFIGDSILVAHNADFDFNFLKEAMVRLGKPTLNNAVIDTLDLSRYCLPARRGYRLGAVARNYRIAYDEQVAHRADYDAKVLSEVFLHLMKDLKDNNGSKIETLNDMVKLNIGRLGGFSAKHITVLAKNEAGIKDIFELVSISHTDYLAEIQKSAGKPICEPRIPREIITRYREKGNLLIGSSCLNGEVFDLAHTRNDETLERAVSFYDYIEVQPKENYRQMVERGRIASENQLEQMLKSIIAAGEKQGKIVVATGDAHYVGEDKHVIRDIYISAQAIGGIHHPLYIYDDEDRMRIRNPEQHLRTTDEMLDAFAFLGEEKARELVVVNSNKIADMIEHTTPIKSTLCPPHIEGCVEKLKDICFQTAHDTYGEQLPEIVENRLNTELNSIIGHGYAVIYYISHLLVHQSNKDGYLVGSRGSVGSSFVACMAQITEVNSLKPHYICPDCKYSDFDVDEMQYASGFDLPERKCPKCGAVMHGQGQNIPFETFLGFAGDKVPDIDLNFSGEYQGKAHKYIQQVFGEKFAFRAGTIGTVAEKTAFGYVQGYIEDRKLEGKVSSTQINRLAAEAAGVRRTTSQHPGGIIVFPQDRDVSDFTPVQFPANDLNEDMKTTHLDYHDIEKSVLKFDILGHVDPTAMKMLEEISGVDVTKIPMNDKDTMSIFSSTDALNIDTTKYHEKTGAAGLPEFGTRFVRGILEETKPTSFEELVKISGLSHGTDVWLNNAQSLIAKKTCTLKEVIGCRDDIMLYLIAKGLEPKLAFTIMESVRKGRGLKDEWIPEMKAHGVEDYYIDSCLKIKYMFPKAHAVAYVIMAIRIAWFKVHMPLHYYCQFFSIRCDAYDLDTMIKGEASIRTRMNNIQQRLNDPSTKRDVSKKEIDIFNGLELALEMVLRGYRFATIDINLSQATRFSIDPRDKQHTILPSFTSVDGLGANVAESVVKAREEAPFLSKEDLLNRTQLSQTLVKKLEQLGALDGMQDENQMSLF